MASPARGKFQARPLHVGLVVLVGVALLLLVTRSEARPPYSHGWSPYRISLEDTGGAPLRSFVKGGTVYVLGYMGERFNVRIQNDGDERVAAVLSVDGRDAVSGGVGNYGRQRGYLVPAHGSVVVEGFRQSLSDVAAFRFTRPASSYSSRMGTPENVGVVGVAIFPERRAVRRPPPPYHYEDDRYEDAPRADARRGRSSSEAPSEKSAGSAPAPKSAPRDAEASREPARKRSASPRTDGYGDSPGRLGTEYGERSWSPVTEVPFERADALRPAAVLTLRYDDAEGLRARGIEPYPHRSFRWEDDDLGRPSPDPFPESRRFAPPPP
jgi:hypothetical protein